MGNKGKSHEASKQESDGDNRRRKQCGGSGSASAPAAIQKGVALKAAMVDGASLLMTEVLCLPPKSEGWKAAQGTWESISFELRGRSMAIK